MTEHCDRNTVLSVSRDDISITPIPSDVCTLLVDGHSTNGRWFRSKMGHAKTIRTSPRQRLDLVPLELNVDFHVAMRALDYRFLKPYDYLISKGA